MSIILHSTFSTSILKKFLGRNNNAIMIPTRRTKTGLLLPCYNVLLPSALRLPKQVLLQYTCPPPLPPPKTGPRTILVENAEKCYSADRRDIPLSPLMPLPIEKDDKPSDMTSIARSPPSLIARTSVVARAMDRLLFGNSSCTAEANTSFAFPNSCFRLSSSSTRSRILRSACREASKSARSRERFARSESFISETWREEDARGSCAVVQLLCRDYRSCCMHLHDMHSIDTGSICSLYTCTCSGPTHAASM